MSHLTSLLPGKFSPSATLLQELFNEYESGITKEAKLVKDVDKYELLVQAVEYERDTVERGEQLVGLKDLTSFFGVGKGINTDLVRGWAEDVMKERELLWKSLSKKTNVVNGTK